MLNHFFFDRSLNGLFSLVGQLSSSSTSLVGSLGALLFLLLLELRFKGDDVVYDD